MHKLTARIIQCIVPHKLIVLDLLNFCYHKLHVQFHRGVLSRVRACQYLLPLTLLTFRAVCFHQSSPEFAVQVPVLVRNFGECLQATSLLTTPCVKVYSRLSPCLFENDHGLTTMVCLVFLTIMVNNKLYNTFNNVVLQFVFVRINQVYLYCCSYHFKNCCEK